MKPALRSTVCLVGLIVLCGGASAHAIGVTTLTPNIDFDGDGVSDPADNSPGQSNLGQEDNDNDLIGNAGEVYAGLNPNDTDSDNDGDIDLIDTTPLGNGNPPAYNTPYVVDFDPLYAVTIGDSLVLDFTFTRAIGASDNYLRVAFDLAINGAGDDFWYSCHPNTLTAVLTPADMTTLGINSPGLYTATTRGGEFGWISTDEFLIAVAVPEPASAALLAIGALSAALLAWRNTR